MRMTHFGGKTPSDLLLESRADWISPGSGSYYKNPPAGDGRQVVIVDSDHIRPLGADYPWVWKSFCRGLNVILMDSFTVESYGTFEKASKVSHQ